MEGDLISGAAAAAKYLGLPRRQVYRMVDEQQLPFVRKGRRLFFLKSELRKSFMSRNAPKNRVHRFNWAGMEGQTVIDVENSGPRIAAVLGRT